MATSSELNQFLEYVDEKVLECTICFKRLQNPKSLNCLHSFCLTCLENWVKTKGKLTCPTCSKSYAIPEGGLQKLPPNTFLNNLFEAIEQIAKRDQKNCVCGKQQATYYCQECRHYLCKTCSDCHKVFPALANHKLRTVEDVGSMTAQDFALLHPPLCSLHNKSLEFYCTDCATPICINCTLTEHKVWEGKHKAISISEAFQIFKETSTKLEEAAQSCKNKLEGDLQTVSCNATTFEQSKNTCLRDIDNHVQTLMTTIKENGEKMKNEVEKMYEIYTTMSDAYMDELRTIISDINTKLSFLNQLLKSNDATAMQSSETVITALKDRINELPKTKPSDSTQIHFSINEQQIASLLENDIGIVTQPKLVEVNVVEHFTTKVADPVTDEVFSGFFSKPTRVMPYSNSVEQIESIGGDTIPVDHCYEHGRYDLAINRDQKGYGKKGKTPTKEPPTIEEVTLYGNTNHVRSEKRDPYRDVVQKSLQFIRGRKTY